MELRRIRLLFRHHVTLVDLSVHVPIWLARYSHWAIPRCRTESPLERLFLTLLSLFYSERSLSLSFPRSFRHLSTLFHSPLPTHIRIKKREAAFASRTLPKAQKWKRLLPASLEGRRKRRACLWTITFLLLSRSMSLLVWPSQR